ncbi:MAG: hypothetical protein AAGF49_11825 [Pseudomonadota bacterium]
MIRILLAASVLAIAAGTAHAKQAKCYNTDDGTYACDFRQFGGDGSFTVSAPVKPSYTISIVERNVADGFVDYGNGNTALPGTFYKSRQDRACWVSDATDFTICAY